MTEVSNAQLVPPPRRSRVALLAAASTDWPALPYADWEPTKQTLHRYTQIIGKVRMALIPPLLVVAAS